MSVQIVITGENGLDAATQLRNFIVGLHVGNPLPTAAQAKEGVVADKTQDVMPPKKVAPKKAAAPVEDDEEEEAPPAKKAAPKKAVEEDEEEEAPVKKKKAAEPAKLKELVDDGEEQPATVDGCRIMVRRVARAKGAGSDHAQAILAEFGVAGASKVPEKKMQAFIDRCQEVIDDPESIEVE
jgi:hypothetical protein